ncbi:MAG: MarR family transcriptional regulator [Candidatus Omnitrophica bacterium]|nr:MarR family transcriptional regulator [Candidatus Omnitrophota bacterium]
MSKISLPEFADKVNRIMPLIAREFLKKQAQELFKGKITLSQLFILDYLYKEGYARMTDLAHFMEVSTAAMTGLVDRLVRDGYVYRIFEPRDRRIIKVGLTAKGNALVERIDQQKKHMIMEIFGRISQIERSQYLNILTHIYEILTKKKKP